MIVYVIIFFLLGVDGVDVLSVKSEIKNVYFRLRWFVKAFQKKLNIFLLKRRKHESRKELLPFVTQYQPSVPNLKNVLMEKWHLIQNQPSLRQIFKEPPLISYKRGKSLKDILVRAKL